MYEVLGFVQWLPHDGSLMGQFLVHTCVHVLPLAQLPDDGLNYLWEKKNIEKVKNEQISKMWVRVRICMKMAYGR